VPKKIQSAISDLTPPLLIFGYGNPSRGDDALGPLLIVCLEALDLPNVELLTDFQLQIEHALDLQNRERVLFVDASISCAPPYSFSRLNARKDASFTSHVMSPWRSCMLTKTYMEFFPLLISSKFGASNLNWESRSAGKPLPTWMLPSIW
jgi:Ni,Fe-hydrogenase maturation factor